MVKRHDPPPDEIDPPAANSHSASSPTAKPDAYQLSDAARTHERHNFIVLALYQVIMRTGWIFKTESIVMPAVLDTITGGGPLGGFLRGWLPVLNRLGHSIPPILFSRRLKVLPRKRSVTIVCTSCMATVFLVLSGIWWMAGKTLSWWMPLAFLASYLTFFVATGLNNLSFGTLQGKLIHATRRGRLLLVASVVGSTTAILAVWLLMPLWLTPDGGRFEMIFGLTAVCFAVAALTMFLVVEPKDDYNEPRRSVKHLFASTWTLVRTDRDFRRLAWVAMAFGSSLMLFPHYQALGRGPGLGLTLDDLILWLIVQNTGTGLFSLIVGPIADRRGNRLVMQLVLLGIAVLPVIAIVLAHWPEWGADLYPLVFLFVGLTPVGFKTIGNYALEISTAQEHPRYLSTLGLCFAAPLVLSPVLGWMVEATGYEAVFLAVSGGVFAGWLLTFRLREPRHAILAAPTTTAIPETE